MPIPVLLAYLDPSTGSIWFQVVLGAVVGTAALARQYWAALRALWRSVTGGKRSAGAARPRL